MVHCQGKAILYMKTRSILFSILIVLIFWGTGSAQSSVPRTIITFYDSKENSDIRTTRIHRYLEMAINHLGLKFKYLDINKPLPDLKDLEDLSGTMMLTSLCGLGQAAPNAITDSLQYFKDAYEERISGGVLR